MLWQGRSKNNYAIDIVSGLEKEGLPLQFKYLPLQESGYDPMAIGPETRYGVAKGAWQFLASTGQEYGLTVGPLADTENTMKKMHGLILKKRRVQALNI